jgi:hypothetical protein
MGASGPDPDAPVAAQVSAPGLQTRSKPCSNEEAQSADPSCRILAICRPARWPTVGCSWGRVCRRRWDCVLPVRGEQFGRARPQACGAGASRWSPSRRFAGRQDGERPYRRARQQSGVDAGDCEVIQRDGARLAGSRTAFLSSAGGGGVVPDGVCRVPITRWSCGRARPRTPPRTSRCRQSVAPGGGRGLRGTPFR